MKKILFTTAILFSMAVFPQSADERIRELIDRSDWFGLEENYPALKDSMHTGFLKLMSEIMIDYNFNRPDEAISNIRKLLVNHQHEIGSSNAINMAILSCQIEGLKGNYYSAALNAQILMDWLKGQKTGEELYKGLKQTFDFYNKLKSIPAPSITRPTCGTSVPIEIEKVPLPASVDPKGWRGTTILIPVKINGKAYHFIFDTGAGTSFMSERFAEEAGVRILNDSLIINSTLPGAMNGRMGTLDNMQIGDMIFHYPLITVAPPNVLDSVMRVDAVLGMDFINLFDELRIYPKEEKIVFPASPTPLPSSGRNLMLSERGLKLKADTEEETLKLHFDTGCSTAGLYYRYYKSHKPQVDSRGKPGLITSGGFNTIVTKEVLRLPSFRMDIGNVPVELKNLSVDITDNGFQTSDDAGILGMDMINQFDCVIINLKDMFLKPIAYE